MIINLLELLIVQVTLKVAITPYFINLPNQIFKNKH